MQPALLLSLCSFIAAAQTVTLDPFDRAMQLSQQARNQGNPAEAAARREEARNLLEQMPVSSPQWLGRVQNLAQSYQGSGRHVQARTVVQNALDRADALPQSNPSRVELLNMLAQFWQQDGNLLKALSFREKAIAAFEATPPGAAAQPPQRDTAELVTFVGGFGGRFASRGRFGGLGTAYLYDQLASLYRELGRLEDAAKTVAKIRSLLQNDPGALANSYEQSGDLDQARALYRKEAEAAETNPKAQPGEIAGPLQSIASLYEREERWSDAVAALEQAAARLDAGGGEPFRSQAASVRLRIANLLQRAGQRQGAEQAYQTLLNRTAGDQPDLRIQVVDQYATYLSETDRGSQGMQMLKDFLANHSDLQPWQETNILFALSRVARQAGQKDLADEYQRVANEKQRAQQVQQAPAAPLIGPTLQSAQRAANEGHLEEAVNLALDAMASASSAPDGEQVAWQVPNLAAQLAGRKAPEKGGQLYRALFPSLESRAADNLQPLSQAQQQYARFLMGQKDRWEAVALAIDRYRDGVITAQGAETSGMVQVQQLRIELAQSKIAHEEAVQKADELLALEASLSGSTSAPYLNAAQTAANVYQSNGKLDLALDLHRQIVAIGDRTLQPGDAQRGFLRMNAARVFAAARQFDEAERLAEEALAIGQSLRPPRSDLFRGEMEQIRRMKADAQSGAVTVQPGFFGTFISGAQR